MSEQCHLGGAGWGLKKQAKRMSHGSFGGKERIHHRHAHTLGSLHTLSLFVCLTDTQTLAHKHKGGVSQQGESAPVCVRIWASSGCGLPGMLADSSHV